MDMTKTEEWHKSGKWLQKCCHFLTQVMVLYLLFIIYPFDFIEIFRIFIYICIFHQGIRAFNSIELLYCSHKFIITFLSWGGVPWQYSGDWDLTSNSWSMNAVFGSMQGPKNYVLFGPRVVSDNYATQQC